MPSRRILQEPQRLLAQRQWRRRATNRWVPLRERDGVVAGTDYPAERDPGGQRDATSAAYAMLSFGGEEPVFGDVRLAGNIGVRYVNTAAGIRSAPSPSPAPRRSASTSPSPSAAPPTPPPPPPAGAAAERPGGVCRLGEAGYKPCRPGRATGATRADLADNDYDYFLPSLNLKFELNRRDACSASRRRGRWPARELADVRNFIDDGLRRQYPDGDDHRRQSVPQAGDVGPDRPDLRNGISRRSAR